MLDITNLTIGELIDGLEKGEVCCVGQLDVSRNGSIVTITAGDLQTNMTWNELSSLPPNESATFVLMQVWTKRASG